MATENSTAPLPSDAMNEEELRAFDPAHLRYQLEVMSGAHQGRLHPVTGSLVVGSGSDVDLQLTDSTVSRRHVQLDLSSKGVWVKDLGSKNGTFLAGSRVEGFLVRRAATFSLGATLLHLSGVPTGDPNRFRAAFGGALGQSPPMQELFAQLRVAAPTLSTVLLTGETGTGKEVLARALHAESPRRHRPFVVVDCGAIAESLVESQLFGHARGAFTGADTAREGAFASAHGGTVFLDEVGELPLALQPRLLRVLESRTVRAVGADVERPVDVRVVVATHRDLVAATRAGEFREDLYFRLAVVVVRVPPLRERLDDIGLLTGAILARLGRPDFELSPALLERMRRHGWPGNVRELRNAIERAVSGVTEGAPGSPATEAAEAPAEVAAREPVEAPSEAGQQQHLPYKQAKEQLIEDFTREYFTRLFEASGRNVAEMARSAGIARTYAHEVIKKYGLKPG